MANAFPFWIFFITFYGLLTWSKVIGIEDEMIAHFPTAWATNISSSCYDDSQIYLKAYSNRDKWASKMYKSTGTLSFEGLRNMEVFPASPGLFDECLYVKTPSFRGQYCSAFFRSKAGDEPAKVIEQEGDRWTANGPNRVGFCIPSSCRASDFRSSVAQIARKALEGNHASSIIILTDENYCYTQKKIDSAPIFDGLDITFLVILCILGLLILSGTLYDSWRLFKEEQIDSKLKKFLHCFSALENGRKVLSMESAPSDLPCLHGIRALSAMWIIFVHSNRLLDFYPFENKYGPDRHHIHQWSTQAFIRGLMAVDTFIMLGGFLVSYTLLRELNRNDGRFNPFSLYLHRFIRITPFYYFLVGFIATLFVYMGTGPLWHNVRQLRDSCRSGWWTHFLYISNYYDGAYPPGEGWYLAVDIQLFILSPLFVYPLWKKTKAGLAWIAFAIMAILAALLSIHILWSTPATISYLERPKERGRYLAYNYPDHYFQTWARLPQYLAGIISGWLVLNYRKKKIHWIGVASGWVLSLAVVWAVVFGLVPFLDEGLVPEMNSVFRVAYGTLFQFAWSVAIGWIIFACLSGYGGIVNTILSWKVFMPLGRLSFVVYLTHVHYITLHYMYLSRVPLYYTKFNLVMTCSAVTTITFISAFFLSIFIEMPFINLDRNFLNVAVSSKTNNTAQQIDLHGGREHEERKNET